VPEASVLGIAIEAVELVLPGVSGGVPELTLVPEELSML
jgi:hypothetical protein